MRKRSRLCFPRREARAIGRSSNKDTIMHHGLIAWLIIGAIAGWLAGVIMKGKGFGIVADIIVGIVGAFIGGFLAGTLHIAVGSGFIASLIVALIGACVLVFLIRLVKRVA
ncbi:MAG TPA: GlsB/YeaQ/YmgE family stress response membrane protein [Tepidiformaceae bacterium]|nr:GlsB/YeaQ/YmgE family stress response membrane protein [Tepidiformaceae bacterium]